MKNSLVLAYLGDAVYELYIREHLISMGISNVNDLQRKSLDFVSAKSQRKHLENLINDNVLTEEEIELSKRGRNAKGGKSKSSDIVTYRIATGLEYVIGYLYLENKMSRIKEIMDYITKGCDE